MHLSLQQDPFLELQVDILSQLPGILLVLGMPLSSWKWEGQSWCCLRPGLSRGGRLWEKSLFYFLLLGVKAEFLYW